MALPALGLKDALLLETTVKLYSYYRSSAAYRLRIALNYKGLDWDYIPVNLLTTEQKSAAYLAQNPQGLVPALALDDGIVLSQSVAVLEWLEETHPNPPLLPLEPLQRAYTRALVNHIACDIHPLNNISILQYLRGELAATEEQVHHWYCHWIDRGFGGLERQLAGSGPYCMGQSLSMADVCLVPQVYNARRFNVPLDDFPTVVAIANRCEQLPAFAKAHPDNQPDAP